MALNVSTNVFINPGLTEAEASAAYEERCSVRRHKCHVRSTQLHGVVETAVGVYVLHALDADVSVFVRCSRHRLRSMRV